MTKEEAIAWAVNYIAEGFEYEFFTKQALARKAAKAMTLLSGKRWCVQFLTATENTIAGYWVQPTTKR